LSRRGSFPFVHSIDHLGPFADDLPGLALAYDVLQGPDPQDPACFATALEPTVASLAQGVMGLRVGLLGGYFEALSTPAAREAALLAADALGAHTTVARGIEWPDAAAARAAAFIVTASEGGQLHMDSLRTRAADHEPLSVDRLIAGALQPAAWYVRAQRFRRRYRDQVNALFRDWDVLIAPATPLAAPAIGSEWVDINGQRLPCRPSIGLLTQPVSFSGCPVVTAPIWPGGTGGLPIGVQLIAAPWREDLALRAGWALARSGVAQVKESVL
jgi:amidase/aspartyl-tRNA(Asn)/glutamyl-tRNA(Gln) amidotransferase subunit A